MKYTLTIIVLALILSCTSEKSSDFENEISSPVMPTKELNAAFLIVNGVYNSELIAPMDVLHHTVFHVNPGIRVFTVAPTREVITTFEGLRIIPDYSFLTDSLPPIDILIVPSAEHSMDTDLENIDLIDFVKKSGKKASYFMSLCDGAFVLAKAGLLDLHECTTFPGDIQRFRETYPNLKVHENVSFVHDRKAITSSGGAKSYDPSLYLVEYLYGKEVAQGIGKGLVIDWDLKTVQHIRLNR
ncbi:MAG: glutamine amidotransferase [Flammeovirgaceae bacterium]|nr:glutamine amidotransferase [Flammeovirgaceae bacterium]